jgi:hypothetical protein
MRIHYTICACASAPAAARQERATHTHLLIDLAQRYDDLIA